jgi:hypothetical protein
MAYASVRALAEPAKPEMLPVASRVRSAMETRPFAVPVYPPTTIWFAVPRPKLSAPYGGWTPGISPSATTK